LILGKPIVRCSCRSIDGGAIDTFRTDEYDAPDMALPPHERYKEKLFPGSSHSWAISQCEQLDRSVTVLDIGSGSGVMGAQLRDLGFSSLHAIEVDAEARAQTASLYSDMVPLLSSFADRKFGLVLLLDVIEHMTRPEQFMAELLPLLIPNATILLSVPNVAHWSVRLPLLLGSFRYTERGILDKTHVRFFTRSSLRLFLKSLGPLSIVHESVSVPPAEFVLPKLMWNNPPFRAISTLHYQAAQVLPGLLGYQLLTGLRYRG
jgi:SAM-dependent methyltransferase